MTAARVIALVLAVSLLDGSARLSRFNRMQGMRATGVDPEVPGSADGDHPVPCAMPV